MTGDVAEGVCFRDDFADVVVGVGRGAAIGVLPGQDPAQGRRKEKL
jgi:hypothetical protein